MAGLGRTPNSEALSLKALIGRRVDDAIKVPVEHLSEDRFVGVGPQEQRRRRVKLLCVDIAEYLPGRSSLRAGNDARAFDQPWAKHRMMQIRLRLLHGGDRVRSRHLALSQASDLRKHEPHPVARLVTAAQLCDG